MTEFHHHHHHRCRRCRLAASLEAIITAVLLVLNQAQLISTESMWCPDVCHCYNNMKTLDCSQRRLSVVPARMPQSARRVYLEDNNIGQVDLQEFTGSQRVSQLVLDRNRLTAVETATFCMMTSLQELSLSANMIKSFHVSSGAECVCVALRQLDLSLNVLSAVPVNLSSFAPRLQVLDLSCNEITHATLDSSFTQFTSLRQLDLSRNRIHLLSATDLEPLRHVSLDVLNLAETELAVIEHSALSPLSASLKYLSLTGNPLRPDNLARALAGYASTSDNLTEHNTSELSATRGSETVLPLTRLSIGEMTVGNLTQDMLAPFHHLLVLDVAFSDLEWVDPELFNHLTCLETLHLEASRLTAVENLSTMKNLRRIHLQRNQLTQIVTLSGLYKLVLIDLSYNCISHVPAFWLDGFRHLQVISTFIAI